MNDFSKTSWPSRAPIGRFDWSTPENSRPHNPRGWWFGDKLDSRTPGYADAFREKSAPIWSAACDTAAAIGCQIIYEHDPEGSEVREATYRGHILTDSPPEQTIDFIRWRVKEAGKRGLRWGCTFRHTHYLESAGEHVSLAPPAATLQWEMEALRETLGPGVGYLYADTFTIGVKRWQTWGPGPLPASHLMKVQKAWGADRFLIGSEFGGVSCPEQFKKWGATDKTWGDPAYYQVPGVACWRYVETPASPLTMLLTARGGFDIVIPRSTNVFDKPTMDRLTKEFRMGHVPVVGVMEPVPSFNAPVLEAWRKAQA